MRRALALIAVAVCTALGVLPAHAAEQRIRDLQVSYAIQAEGSVDVVWEGDIDFVEPGGRGIIHLLVEREPWDQDREQLVRYDISDVEVTSPTGAPTGLEVDLVSMGGVDYVELRIGDEDQPFTETRQTYRIAYTLDGAMREFDGRPELFWDINTADELPIDELQVTVTAPDGVTEARCLQGAKECEVSVDGGTATYRASGVEGEIVSVVAGMAPGTVAIDGPMLQPRREDMRDGLDWKWAGLGALAAFVLGIGLEIQGRPRRKDVRWSAVAPGVMDPGGPTTTTPAPNPPVRFTPPDATVAEAGRAVDAKLEASHVTATVVDMAVRGELLVTSDPFTLGTAHITLPEDPLRRKVFDAVPRMPSEPTRAHLDGLRAAVEGAMPTGEQRLTTPATSKGGGCVGIALVVGIIALLAVPIGVVLWGRFVDPFAVLRVQRFFTPAVMMSAALLVLAFFVALVPAGWAGSAVARRFDRRDSRTPRGSAIRAQAEGFRRYLATAEAAQLDFEADRNIYRRYLPWAVLFGLTERWARVGDDLRAMGLTEEAQVRLGDELFEGLGLQHALEDFDERVRPVVREHDDRRTRSSGSSGDSSRHGSGSGGSSGFSSDATGGGGGGGSRTRTW